MGTALQRDGMRTLLLVHSGWLMTQLDVEGILITFRVLPEDLHGKNAVPNYI